MTDYTIIKKIMGYKNSKTINYDYSIKKNGKFLHEGCAKMSFSTMEKAERFAENFDEESAVKNGYRWF